jgi:hypothetical protein
VLWLTATRNSVKKLSVVKEFYVYKIRILSFLDAACEMSQVAIMFVVIAVSCEVSKRCFRSR